MLTNLEQIIRDYFPSVVHMSLASCKDNKPWVCEVHFVYDDNLNLYFRSKPIRRHSQEITLNPFVSGNIVTQHNVEEKPRWIYFEGKAEQIEVKEDSQIYMLFCERIRTDNSIVHEQHQEDGHKFYKITVSDYYIFDEKESNPSAKYHLPRFIN